MSVVRYVLWGAGMAFGALALVVGFIALVASLILGLPLSVLAFTSTMSLGGYFLVCASIRRLYRLEVNRLRRRT